MQIHIICVQKNDDFKIFTEKYLKLIRPFAFVDECRIFSSKIAQAQKTSAKAAQKSYEQEFLAHKKGFNIILDERGKTLNSLEFAELLEGKNELSFFIGGAYGFESGFLKHFDFTLSLSALTLAHQFVKILLLEQIYRAFCIKHQHPYHK